MIVADSPALGHYAEPGAGREWVLAAIARGIIDHYRHEWMRDQIVGVLAATHASPQQSARTLRRIAERIDPSGPP